MCCKQIISIFLGMLAVFPVLAQGGNAESPNPCTVEPIFHCAQSMNDGSIIGHFGYRSLCPESEEPAEDKYVPIGDDNSFAPEPVDRGQSTVFIPGEHVDEFEVEFSAREIKQGKEYSWTVLGAGVSVDFSMTKDAMLDCNRLSY